MSEEITVTPTKQADAGQEPDVPGQSAGGAASESAGFETRNATRSTPDEPIREEPPAGTSSKETFNDRGFQ